MLQKLKISQKIYVLGIGQLALMLLMGLVSLGQMAKIGQELVDIAEEDIPLTNYITELASAKLTQAVLLETALFKASLLSQGQNQAAADYQQASQQLVSLESDIDAQLKRVITFTQEGINKLHSEQAKAEYRIVLSDLRDIANASNTLKQDLQELLRLAAAGQFEAVFRNSSSVEKQHKDIDEQLVKLLQRVQKFTLEAARTAEHDEQKAIIWIAIVFVISLVFGVSAPFVISKAITKPVVNLQQRLYEIATGDGDLRVCLDESAKDETGDVARAFNEFISMLRRLISNTSSEADNLGTSSETALSVMQETLRNVEQQREETELVATAVTEMNSTTQEVARSTVTAAEVTEKVKASVLEGREGALETKTIIQQLNEEIRIASKVIEGLAGETNKIGSVMANIQGIAEQTNLLALNAAIEAARAGDSGRGFAVVADEVRSLAQRTQTSTVDIQQLVERLQSEADNAVQSMDKGSDSAQHCLDKATDTAQIFEQAASSVAEISDLNTQIATAAEEQTAVADEINKNLLNIRDIAEVTASGARKTAQANKDIAKSLIDLHTSLNVFQT